MAIFSRIADILKANINDMIDHAEDPEKMAKQIILEMEEQVDAATRSLGQAMASQKMAAKSLDDAKSASADWENKAKLALAAGNDELARKALDSKVNVDAQVAQLQISYDQMTEQVNKLREQVADLKQKLEEARARQNVLIARSRVADAMTQAATAVGSTNTDSAFSKLDKMEQKVSEKEATAEAYNEINGADKGTADEFKQLEHTSAVDSEMERLKKEMGL